MKQGHQPADVSDDVARAQRNEPAGWTHDQAHAHRQQPDTAPTVLGIDHPTTKREAMNVRKHTSGYLLCTALVLGSLVLPVAPASAGWFDTARCGVLNGELVAAKATAAGLERLTPAVLAKQIADATARIAKAERDIKTATAGLSKLAGEDLKTAQNKISMLKLQISKDKLVIAAAKRAPGDRERAQAAIKSVTAQLKKYKC